MPPVPGKLTFDLLTFKMVSESHVTWVVFLSLSVLELGLMYATDRRQTDVRRASSLNASGPRGGGIIMLTYNGKIGQKSPTARRLSQYNAAGTWALISPFQWP